MAVVVLEALAALSGQSSNPSFSGQLGPEGFLGL